MAYATYSDVQGRMTRTMSEAEQTVCTNLLDDAALIIDAYNADASADNKKLVSINIVKRAIGDAGSDIPMGATQGSMAGLGYSQSWTISSGGCVGDLYLNKYDKKLLGLGNKIGSYSPVEELGVAPCVE